MSPHCGTNLKVLDLTTRYCDLKFYLLISSTSAVHVTSLHGDLDQNHILVLLHG
jgi:hypothetical protein